ncbi:UxaA family hydrolase [Sphingomonas azotifigens]|uniref:UxaA family hydrolase n=1 Tax=Sphingomonas azotifigens TaxID=330920 RepID=UPI000A01197D|nr:altronate dehydratase family protein [Sphingomonas azotifigens]
MLPALFQIDPRDPVATALRDIDAGESALGVVVAQPIPKGHKVALQPIVAGAPVHKFGFPIGRATQPIAPGEHVHTHNVATALETSGSYAYQPALEAVPGSEGPSFLGYRRSDGRVGTRNEIWILPTVGCVGRTAEKIAERAAQRFAGRVDGIHAFAHPFGCSQLGDDLAGTRAILTALANHPNAGGVLLVGLGCESNQLRGMLPGVHQTNLRSIGAQAAGDEIEEGVALIEELIVQAEQSVRTAAPLADLVLGVKCGGSDGFSGLTANPLVGRMSDAVTAASGTAILTEIPEIFGAEQLLMARAESEPVFERIVSLVNGFKAYFTRHGEPVSENPSPGNLAGGITTLEEKSLGAVQKAGHATVTDVLGYGERVRRRGLTLLEAPGNDAVSSTALAAAGATVILFTTGRGTPLGFPVPTIKIASNSDLAARKPGWIDFDAGQVLAEGMDAAAATLLDRIVAIASGTPTAAERNGEREIAIWKRGVTL